MSTEKHTHGLIEVTDQRFIRYSDGDRHVIARCTRPNADNLEKTSEVARRLVACWNACEGVPTEVLEAQQSGGLPWSVADQIEQRVQFDAYKEGSEEAFGAVVEQKRKAEECVSRMESTIQSQQGVIVKMRTQRDELLAALEQIAQANHPDYPHFKSGTEAEFADHLIAVAANAIAKVKGGAA